MISVDIRYDNSNGIYLVRFVYACFNLSRIAVLTLERFLRCVVQVRFVVDLGAAGNDGIDCVDDKVDCAGTAVPPTFVCVLLLVCRISFVAIGVVLLFALFCIIVGVRCDEVRVGIVPICMDLGCR